MDKIDLDAIIEEHGMQELKNITKNQIKSCMKEAIHQALVLASEKVKIKDKKSILNIVYS